MTAEVQEEGEVAVESSFMNLVQVRNIPTSLLAPLSGTSSNSSNLYFSPGNSLFCESLTWEVM